MLTPQDESLLHQAPLTFSETTTSDHRFYDRVWVTAADPNGGAELAIGLGLYKNMNVLDGFTVLALRNIIGSRGDGSFRRAVSIDQTNAGEGRFVPQGQFLRR